MKKKMTVVMVGVTLIVSLMGALAAVPAKQVNFMKAGKWETKVEILDNGKPQKKQTSRTGCIKQDWIDAQKFFEPSSRIPITDAKSCNVEAYKKEPMTSGGMRASWKTICKLNMDETATIDFLNEVSEKNVMISSEIKAKMGQDIKSMSFKKMMKHVGDCTESDPALFGEIPAKK
jgi:hypothetical protein